MSEQLSVDENNGSDIFLSEFGSFHERAKIKIEILNSQFESMQMSYAQASHWLFEDPKNTKPASLFKSILDFLSALRDTKIKVQEKLHRAKKVAERQEKKHGNKSGKPVVTNPSITLLKSANQKREMEKRRRFSVDAWSDLSDDDGK